MINVLFYAYHVFWRSFNVSESNDEVFRAKIGATTFFFFMVLLVLSTIADTNLPNLKVGG
ncbi:hypothetical protein [Colwellia sp. PAMC 20917]|uniref:hypothetical protein n=1 Tax=Colwellia sp. PAMC 20917 TaxID=1816218 RepID=UPI0012F73AD5|nr:hypothetical protein [Colwellia sp. PAMC 20917]